MQRMKPLVELARQSRGLSTPTVPTPRASSPGLSRRPRETRLQRAMAQHMYSNVGRVGRRASLKFEEVEVRTLSEAVELAAQQQQALEAAAKARAVRRMGGVRCPVTTSC